MTYSPNKVQRRFIAGAKCPECSALDKLQQCIEGEKKWLSCVACGYSGDLSEPRTAAPSSEVSQVEQHSSEEGVVKFTP